MDWDIVIDFLLLRDPNVRYVVLGSVLIGASAALTGCFLFLRKRALVGDAIAHAVLPGICLAFLVFKTKNPAILLAGAILTGWLSLLFIDWITNKSRIKTDTAIGLTLSWFFGIGIMLLTAIQKTGNASQTGLDKFIFGKAASMVDQDVFVFGGLSIVVILVIFLFFKPLKLISFDRDFASSIGLPVGRYDFLLSTLTVLAVATGIQAVGVVLMAALLITPAAAARFWTDKLKRMLLLAATFGAFSGIVGAFISYTTPRMPTGPWIVIVISVIAIFSFLFGAKKGLVVRQVRQQKMQRKILRENILKLFYKLAEEDGQLYEQRGVDQLTNRRFFIPSQLKTGLQQLLKENLLEKADLDYRFTEKGVEEGKRITRLHRLWEMYLTQYLKIAPDHVHDDAEAIEHIITPEIEAELVHQLEMPELDPHDSTIPYGEKLPNKIKD
ncbi:MAG: metal ABC transporter permease [Saprospiraceae bacterium]|nr:metal ABC transporter permease [Saprospiraceae bacterium]